MFLSLSFSLPSPLNKFSKKRKEKEKRHTLLYSKIDLERTLQTNRGGGTNLHWILFECSKAESASCFCKGPESKQVLLCGPPVLVAATPLCCGCEDSQMVGTEHGCVPVKLSLQKQVAGQLWPRDQTLPTHSREKASLEAFLTKDRVTLPRVSAEKS